MKKRRFSNCLVTLLLSVVAVSEGWAQSANSRLRQDSKPTPAVKPTPDSAAGQAVQVERQSIDQFKQNHPLARFYGTPFYLRKGPGDDASGGGMIYGTTLATGDTPENSAWNHVNEVSEFLGVDVGGFLPEVKPSGEVLQGVMYQRDTGTYKFYTFRFAQYYGGLPVFRSGIGFLTRNEPGNPLVVAGHHVKQIGDFDVGRGAEAEAQVTPAMRKSVKEFFDSQPVMQSVLNQGPPMPIQFSNEELFIYAGTYEEPAEPQVAVAFIAQRGSVQTYPDYQKYLIVASHANGNILLAENQIHNVDVQGNVSGRATDGLGALECHPETSVGLPYAEVYISGGNTTFTDASGNFTIPHGGTSPVTVTSRLRGQWFEVRDQSAGDTIPEISMVVTPPGPANFLHNPAPSAEFDNANVNGYYEANVCRDYILFYEPTFPVIATQQFFDVNTNIGSTCNAFYDGISINFYSAGGGCNNTSMADVVYHEYGHHLISVTNNGQGQMGEGTGDVMGVLMQDEPILAHGFNAGNCGGGIRTANNSHQYPCTGSSHDCGQLLSGCVWDTRNELVLTEPSNYRDIGASLFFGMLIVRGQMQPGNQTIDPSITIMYLELDDDDTDINNGTPHYWEIANGFGAHNMDAPPLELLDFNYPTGRPNMISPSGGVAFTVEVLPVAGTPQPGTGVLYVDRGMGFETFPMNETSPNVYEANFPPSTCGSVVSYYVSAEDSNMQIQFDPEGAPTGAYGAIVGSSSQTVFLDDFETDQGWINVGSAFAGRWERGVPIGGGDRGDPPTDADGSGNCYLTENLDGDSDVDGGDTTLVSPLMDARAPAGQDAIISYYRWYSNHTGADPEADIFVVDITNDRGMNWVNLETVGPTGAEVRGGWIYKSFRVADFVTPTDEMRIRFTASDFGPGSIVEAGVDGVHMQYIGCGNSVSPIAYNVIIGSENAGGVPELVDSDDQYLVLDPTFSQSRYQLMLTVDATSPTPTPSALQFTLEAKTTNFVGDIVQRVELFNYNTGQFEVVDTRNSPGTDSVAVIAPTGDPSRFIQPGTGAMQARLYYQNGLPWWVTRTANLYLPFRTSIDRVSWTITP